MTGEPLKWETCPPEPVGDAVGIPLPADMEEGGLVEIDWSIPFASDGVIILERTGVLASREHGQATTDDT